MTLIQRLRNQLANETGIELTPNEMQDAVAKTDLLVKLVRGQNWGWLRRADTPGQMCMAFFRMQSMIGTRLSWDEAQRIRSIILQINVKANPKPDTDQPSAFGSG